MIKHCLGGEWDSFFYSHLDSEKHLDPNIPETLKKWETIAKNYSSHKRNISYKEDKIFQGTTILGKKEFFIPQSSTHGEIIWENPPYLGHRDSEPRSFLYTQIQIGSTQAIFGCTQLSTLQEESQQHEKRKIRISSKKGKDVRTEQTKKMVEMLKKFKDENRPIILVGDFNCEHNEPELEPLITQLGLQHISPQPDQNTHRIRYCNATSNHKIQIDHIYVSRHFETLQAAAINLDSYKISDAISDHNPVFATIQLNI